MNRISSIVIAKNEEHNIARCIESQLNCIDEIIIIVDKDSSDKTLDIVRSYPNVKHEIKEWLGYAGTKEYALTLATNKWVLWFDADEEITPSLSRELNGWKTAAPAYDIYNLPRRAWFLGRWINHSGWYPGRVERLFNKEKVKFSGSRVHEHLIYSGKTGMLNGDINHYTDPSIKHYFDKFNRYTTLAAEELFAKGKRAGLSDLLLRPLVIFIKMYIIKLGFLDRLQGFILAVFSSAYVFTKYCKLWELNSGNKGEVK